MRFASRSGGDDRRLEMELAGMIDVVFLLIIFFMTTAQFAKDTRAELDLPCERGEQVEVQEEAGVIVNVQADGAIIVAGQPLDLVGLEALLERERTNNPEGARVTLRADRAAASDRLNEIVRVLQRGGVPGARVATEVP